MEISEKQRQFNRNKIIRVINKSKDKIKRKESIKKELFILSQTYDYLKSTHNDSIETIALLDEIVPEFSNYQNRYEEAKKEKRLRRLKLQKQSEYKEAWQEKSIVYRILHRKMDPKRIDFMQMSHGEIKEGIEKLTSKKK